MALSYHLSTSGPLQVLCCLPEPLFPTLFNIHGAEFNSEAHYLLPSAFKGCRYGSSERSSDLPDITELAEVGWDLNPGFSDF